MEKKRKKHARLCSRRKLFGLAALVLCLCILSGTTLAYLVTGANPISDLFSAGEVSCQVNSDLVDTVPTNVTVKNTGTVNAYIRAAVVVNWVDHAGNISANSPEEGVDYTITYAGNSGWKKAEDGFWYYTAPVSPGAFTNILLQDCLPAKSAAPAGCHFHVEVVAAAIQATPGRVVAESWASGVSDLHGSTLIIQEVTQP